MIPAVRPASSSGIAIPDAMTGWRGAATRAFRLPPGERGVVGSSGLACQLGLCKEIANAAHRHGLKLGWYCSTRDWTHPDYLAGDNSKCNDYYHTGGEVKLDQSERGLDVSLPEARRDPVDTVIELRLDRPVSRVQEGPALRPAL